jgi:hypothetical protein
MGKYCSRIPARMNFRSLNPDPYNQNGEPGGSPFQRFFFAVVALSAFGGYAPRARCAGGCLCSKPGGVISSLASVAVRTTISFYACAARLARAYLLFSGQRDDENAFR